MVSLCSIKQKAVSEIEKSCTGEKSTGNKVTGSIKGPYLWFPDSYRPHFTNECAEQRGIHYPQGCEMPILRDARGWKRCPLSNSGVSPAITFKDLFQPRFSQDIKDHGKGRYVMFKSTELFAAICFCFLVFGFSTCLTM